VIVAVTGSRHPSAIERVKVWSILDMFHAATPITLLVHGAATGRDRDAAEWAESRWVPHTGQKYAADWACDGRAAGPIRNSRMLRDANPDMLVAFAGGTGTADCTRKAKALGIRVESVP
jgi:hypothetical protein